MTPPDRRARRFLAALAGAVALGLLLPGVVQGAEDLEDHFRRDWYYTEVVVFQRPGVQDHATDEALARPPAPLPRNLRSFRTSVERWREYQLYPFTRAFMTFPWLDQSRLPAPEQTGRDRFARDDARAPGTGTPPPAIHPRLAPDPLLEFLRGIAEFEAGLEADSYRWLERETFTLSPEARALARRGGFEILLHGRWLQPVPPREAPEPLLIQAGPRDRDGHALEGTIAVTLGRYLHFQARLSYTEPLLGRMPVDRPMLPPSASSPSAGETIQRLSLTDLEPAGVVQIVESRRLRSEELHYLDHPKLGVLIRIEPVTAPEALSAAHLALEEREE